MKNERDFKGIWIPKDIWLSCQLTLQEKCFLVEINSLDNEHGCYANNEYFSNFFGISTTRASLVITSLLKKKYITRKIRQSQGNKRILHTVPGRLDPLPDHTGIPKKTRKTAPKNRGGSLTKVKEGLKQKLKRGQNRKRTESIRTVSKKTNKQHKKGSNNTLSNTCKTNLQSKLSKASLLDLHSQSENKEFLEKKKKKRKKPCQFIKIKNSPTGYYFNSMKQINGCSDISCSRCAGYYNELKAETKEWLRENAEDLESDGKDEAGAYNSQLMERIKESVFDGYIAKQLKEIRSKAPQEKVREIISNFSQEPAPGSQIDPDKYKALRQDAIRQALKKTRLLQDSMNENDYNQVVKKEADKILLPMLEAEALEVVA